MSRPSDGDDVIPLSTFELRTLILGARLVESSQGPREVASARSAQLKLKAANRLAYADAERRTAVLEVPPRTPADPARVESVIAVLARAIEAERSVRIRYDSLSRPRPTWRTVDPHRLFFASGHWYLLGFCHLRHETREFKVLRMLAVEALERPRLVDRPWSPAVSPAAKDPVVLRVRRDQPEVRRLLEIPRYRAAVVDEAGAWSTLRLSRDRHSDAFFVTMALRLGSAGRLVGPDTLVTAMQQESLTCSGSTARRESLTPRCHWAFAILGGEEAACRHPSSPVSA